MCFQDEDDKPEVIFLVLVDDIVILSAELSGVKLAKRVLKSVFKFDRLG